MKKTALLSLCSALLLLAACKGKDANKTENENVDAAVSQNIQTSETVRDINVTLEGEIDMELSSEELVGTEASVSFDHFPASLAEFQQVREKLKDTPQGAVALQVMAGELFRRNAEEGEKALALVNTQTNMPSCIRGLKDKFVGQYANGYDYHFASFLQGATPENGYNAPLPYTIRVCVSVNGKMPFQTYQTDVISLAVYTGNDEQARLGFEVLRTDKPGEVNDGYIVSNSPILYSNAHIREKAFKAEFNGLK